MTLTTDGPLGVLNGEECLRRLGHAARRLLQRLHSRLDRRDHSRLHLVVDLQTLGLATVPFVCVLTEAAADDGRLCGVGERDV